jgi:hypothetical protein
MGFFFTETKANEFPNETSFPLYMKRTDACECAGETEGKENTGGKYIY